MNKRVIQIISFVFLFGMAGYSVAEEPVLPGPIQQEASRDGVSLQTFQNGQTQDQASLQQRAAIQAAASLPQVIVPAGSMLTPDRARVVSLVSQRGEQYNVGGGHYLEVYDVATRTMQYSGRMPERGYYQYNNQKLLAVNSDYALVSSQENGLKLYVVDLRNPTRMRSISVPSASSGIEVAFIDSKTVGILSGDVFKKAYFLSLDNMTLTESPASRGISTPRQHKVISITATAYTNPAWGNVSGYLVSIYDVRTRTTVYRNFSTTNQPISLAGLLQFKIQSVSNQTAIITNGQSRYRLDLVRLRLTRIS